MEFTVGMKLTVRGDLYEADYDTYNTFESGISEDMLNYCLKEVTVDTVLDRNRAVIKEDSHEWTWNKNMFKEFL